MCDDYKYNNRKDYQIEYLKTVGNRISQLKLDLIEETKEVFPQQKDMLTQETEGELLKMLVKLSNGKRGIEIGTFVGYSSICLAEGLPEGGELICFDINKEFTDLAQKYWKLGKLDDKIKLHLGPALEMMEEHLVSKAENLGTFDFAYVDADKPNYINYYENLLKLLKPNGWIVFDNVLFQSKVWENENTPFNECVDSFKKLNAFLREDERVEINMIDLADGITIVRKK